MPHRVDVKLDTPKVVPPVGQAYGQPDAHLLQYDKKVGLSGKLGGACSISGRLKVAVGLKVSSIKQMMLHLLKGVLPQCVMTGDPSVQEEPEVTLPAA